jgi:acetolactate synthase I/II/III large subunit
MTASPAGANAVLISTGEAIARSLRSHGVGVVFGMPGVQTYELFDAFHRLGPDLSVISPRHEQAAGYMAFGYAQSTGRPGVCTVVPGPGVLNVSAALCCAYGASTPVMCVTGQVPASFIGSGKGHLHELPDQLAVLRGLTKWAARVDTPAAASRLIAEGFYHLNCGRPRPVAVEVPWDVLARREPIELATPLRTPRPAAPDDAALERAAALLQASARPMIMVGSGAVQAASEIVELAERLQAPVVSFRGGRGIVSDDHALGFSCAAGARLWKQTDVVLGIGSRMELQWFRWSGQRPDLQTVLVDIDPTQMQRLNPTVAVVGDARASVRALLDLLVGDERPDRTGELRQVKRDTTHQIESVTPYVPLLAAIRQALPRDGYLVEEICQAGFASYFGFPVYAPRTFVTAGHQGALGFGFPTALGVKVAHPDRAVVSITGDGGFQFGLQELATAAQYQIAVVTVLFNNEAYGNVLRDQQRLFEGRVTAAELRNPDFVALARSYGVHAERANGPEQLRSAVHAALGRDEPALIEVPLPRIETGASPWSFLMPTGV